MVEEKEEEAAHLLRDDRVETPRRASFPFSWCYDSLTHTHTQSATPSVKEGPPFYLTIGSFCLPKQKKEMAHSLFDR